MCPIWPLHLIVIYLLAICPLWVVCQTVPSLVASFSPDEVQLNMGYTDYIDVTVTGEGMQVNDEMVATIGSNVVAEVQWNSTNLVTQAHANAETWVGRIRLVGNFLGRTDLTVVKRRSGEDTPIANGTMPVVIIRPERIIDTIFVVSVATFVSLIFINFGCAMHWPTVKSVLKRPIGPLIGMAGQFLFMPLVSFGLGFLIFPDSPEMRLGMFFTGVSPGGGASNIWTFILGGNLNLSLAMSSISTLCSFGFIPLWLFSLGQVVFANANIRVPYRNIATFVIGLIVPLMVGLAMQRWTPKIAAFMVRILKGFSTTLLLFIIVFAIITNLYIFDLFTWQIIVAGMGVPWLGYAVGYLVARLCKQPHADALAISIETGIQNTGIAIFMLRFSLPQPEADLTTVIPVAVAIMTPVPMTCIYIYQKIKACCNRNKHEKMVEEGNTPVSEPGLEPPVVAAIDDGVKPRKTVEDGGMPLPEPGFEPAVLTPTDVDSKPSRM